MQGTLPASARRYRLDGQVPVAEDFTPRPPAGAEVVIAVAGSAVGCAPGAEIAGTVVATGDAAAEWLGRRVVAPRLLPCGECDRCRRGRALACRAPAPRGAPASCETLPSRYLLSVEPPLWPPGAELWQLAALADAAAGPHAALLRAGVAPGSSVVVLGGGVRARMTARLAVALGAHAFLVEPDAGRRRVASARLEGVTLLDGSEPPAATLEAIRAPLREQGPTAFDLTFVEATGRRASRSRALSLASETGGTAVLFDRGDGLPVEADLEAVAAGEARVLGASAAHPDLLPELTALLVRGALRLADELEPLSFEQLGEAVTRRRDGTTDALCVLVPPGSLASSAAIDTGGSARS